MDNDERILMGQRAKSLLNDEVLTAVFASLANHYKTQFENAPRGDTEKMRICHDALHALKDILLQLHNHLNDQKILEADIAAARLRRATE